MAYQASSNAQPHGSAGLSAQAHPDTVEEVGRRGPYRDLVAESIRVAGNVTPAAPQPTLSIGEGVSSGRPDMHADVRDNARGYRDE